MHFLLYLCLIMVKVLNIETIRSLLMSHVHMCVCVCVCVCVYFFLFLLVGLPLYSIKEVRLIRLREKQDLIY